MEDDVHKTQPVISAEESTRHCPACGAEAREQARFCATCGRALEGSYFPMDALRSSYHQQETYEKELRKPFHKKRDKKTKDKKGTDEIAGNFFGTEKNSIAKMALALATYALVPYLGIIFCPCAVLFGGVGFVRSYRFPKHDGRRAAFISIFLGVLILWVQLLLWWLLSTRFLN